MKKFIATREISAENESLIEKTCAICKDVIKSLTHAKAYQVCKYNKFYHQIGYKISQKVWPRVKNITIKQPSSKLDLQTYNLDHIIEKIRKITYLLDLLFIFQNNNVFYITFFFDYKYQKDKKSLKYSSLRLAINLRV